MTTDFKPYLMNNTNLKIKIERELTLYFEAMKMERKASKKNMALNLSEYQIYRHFSVGGNLIVGICNILISNNVSHEMQCTQLYDMTFESFNKIEYMYNDLASFEKDIKEKSTSNLIIVLKHERQYDKWQDAIDEAVQMLKEELKSFEILAMLISFDDGCVRLADMLRRIVQCIFDQSYHSTRYSFNSHFVIGNIVDSQISSASTTPSTSNKGHCNI
ncbi:hypothetical protein B4U80_12094 [Leptotrombidium deliense]|uniref:Terpene synthase n=1 Tax=Leptotrombidium deliense TaxID=299467 RepID=A0A443RYF7_9ACAR|nr:hypothetical protein B4U80_12094 [Leptotrombidium deliense]